jgi:hypothetical protein
MLRSVRPEPTPVFCGAISGMALMALTIGSHPTVPAGNAHLEGEDGTGGGLAGML